MNPSTREILRRVDTWSAEDQEELLEAAMEIEARRVGVYQLSGEERAAVERGLADMREGRFATDEAIAAIFSQGARQVGMKCRYTQTASAEFEESVS